jgi:hypothetical protein
MLGMVDFRPEDYGPDIARILEPAGGGKRLMPLVKPGDFSPEAIEAVKRLKSPPPSVLPGLYLDLLRRKPFSLPLADARGSVDPMGSASVLLSRDCEGSVGSLWQLLFDYCARGQNC